VENPVPVSEPQSGYREILMEIKKELKELRAILEG